MSKIKNTLVYAKKIPSIDMNNWVPFVYAVRSINDEKGVPKQQYDYVSEMFAKNKRIIDTDIHLVPRKLAEDSDSIQHFIVCLNITTLSGKVLTLHVHKPNKYFTGKYTMIQGHVEEPNGTPEAFGNEFSLEVIFRNQIYREFLEEVHVLNQRFRHLIYKRIFGSQEIHIYGKVIPEIPALYPYGYFIKPIGVPGNRHYNHIGVVFQLTIPDEMIENIITNEPENHQVKILPARYIKDNPELCDPWLHELYK